VVNLRIKVSACFKCGACASVCPVDVIEVKDKSIKVKEGCTDCGLCSDTCPVGAIEIE
jgi:ferredoxin